MYVLNFQMNVFNIYIDFTLFIELEAKEYDTDFL